MSHAETVVRSTGLELQAPVSPQLAEILTPGALAFVERLVREFDPRREVLLASGAAADVTTPTSGSEEVRLVSYDAQRIAALVESPSDGYLVLTDTWYPGWKVSVDGRSAELLRADLIFRAVFLPAGKHEVVFTYEPASFRIGTMMTILAALLIVLALLLARRQSATGHW